MKPKYIILVRHGQSEGNVDKSVYGRKPDYALELTEKGRQQADDTGKRLLDFFGKNECHRIQFYLSPFWRARQTYQHIAKYFPCHERYEDPRLREQEWGHIQRDVTLTDKIEEYRDNYGHFYYRFNDGESCADVFDRMSDFLNTLFRDFKKFFYPRKVIIVMHGMSMRVFLMRFLHLSVEEFEILANPKNAEFIILKKTFWGKYKLITPLKTHEVEHPYQFNWKMLDKPTRSF